jgi:hypothetical protein
MGMKKTIITLLLLVSLPVGAAVWRDQRTGIWIGNICQTPAGWQIVPPQPVGSICFSPGWQAYGFIANY